MKEKNYKFKRFDSFPLPLYLYSSVWSERSPDKGEVTGSNPVIGTNFFQEVIMGITREDIWKYTKHILKNKGINISSEIDQLALRFINKEIDHKEFKRLIEKGFGIK